MLDVKLLRNDFDGTKALLDKRNKDFGLDCFAALDREWRGLLKGFEDKKSRQNAISKQIPQLKKDGKDTTAVFSEMKALSDEIKAADAQVKALEEDIEAFLLNVPNTPNPKVPAGSSDGDNLEIRRWGEPRVFGFEPKPHWEIGENLGILDPAAAAKVTGARFTFYKGLGARLERAIINFMLDTHVDEHGYTEVLPPFIAHRRSMQGTGQLPKFAEDMFKLEGLDYYMIPTGEVPVTNMYREEILDGANLPIYHCAYTPCFRAEAGSAGRDTRGLIRQHQFNKVEMVKFVKPEDSYDELEKLTGDAEHILQILNLPYRVVLLCGGDLGFSSAMTYDIEVWMPSYNNYVEISSCSNFEDYQARRAGIRFRDGAGDKPRFAHTLNGSGLAVGRTTAAILEQCQQADGSVSVPEVLVPYMGGVLRIES